MARGGILLRGIGAAHVDVAVVTNVSADHLGLQGIDTLDQLAEVKATVTRIVRPDGWVVLNADDPRVVAMRRRARGRPWVFSLDPDATGVRETLDVGGRATTVLDGAVVVLRGGDVDHLIPVVDVPVTLSGLSSPNTSNALAAAAAALAVGLPRDAVIEGLRTFRHDPELNPGRMNIWVRGEQVVIVDLAHNEESLRALLEVAHGLRSEGGALWTVLGTAGDRTDDLLRLLGEMAAIGSDRVVIAEKEYYLRGRDRMEMIELLRSGAADAGVTDVPAYPTELAALEAALADAGSSDLIAVMCHAEFRDLTEHLGATGFSLADDAWVRERVVG